MAALAGAAVLLVGLGAQRPVEAQRGATSLKADLVGFEEPPAVSSTGSGEFAARFSHDGSSFEYVLSFEDLEGTVTLAANFSSRVFGAVPCPEGLITWAAVTTLVAP